MLLPTLLVLTALLALLLAERSGSRPGVWIAKPLASTGFLWAAISAGALEPASRPYGGWLLAGLVLSWWGDVFLIPTGRPAVLRAGIASFLLGHVAYTIAFASRGLDALAALLAAVALALPVHLVLRWLRPHLDPAMKVPVHAYVIVITAMLICAVASVAEAGRPLILLGAAMFYVSDLAVARDRFVAPGFSNRLWGLPMYYGGQLALAASIAA